MPSASLYVHIPFCASRCGYCTFTSSAYSKEKADAYLAALEKEFYTRTVFQREGAKENLPKTIFIGGGTPSVLTMQQLEKLFSFLPESAGEYSCEINPDSCTLEKLRFLRENGVNRLSFGVQTFDADGLRMLKRRHDTEQAARAVTMALEMGFPAVNIDLINGWPGQTERCVREDMERAAGLGIQHLSNYNLILEPSAAEYKNYCALLGGEIADEEIGLRNWHIAKEVLEKNGFTHYETSNFSLPGFQCRHNVMTWKGEEYLGIGLGACSHIGGARRGNTDDFDSYCRLSGGPEAIAAYIETLPPEEKARECAVFWLRLFEGVELQKFATKTGFDFCELYADVLPGLIADGVVVTDAGKIRVDVHFQPVLDSVLEHFI